MKKKNFEYVKKIRNTWTIKPATKIKENDMKDNKKRRQKDKKTIKEDYINENR